MCRRVRLVHMITESLTCISAAAARASASTACVSATEISSVRAQQRKGTTCTEVKGISWCVTTYGHVHCLSRHTVTVSECRRESGAHPHAKPVLRASEELQPEEQALLLCARHVQRGRRRLCLGCFGKHWHMCLSGRCDISRCRAAEV